MSPQGQRIGRRVPIALLLVLHGLKCEACASYSELKYPSLSDGISEVHHRVPLAELEVPTKTQMKDLAVLCPSSHRAIHRTKPMLSVEAFAAKFFASKA